MRSLKAAVLLLTFIIANAGSTNIYPEWFIFPKNYPQLITGYTYNGMPAVFDAESIYCAYKKCFVVGTLEIFNNASSDKLLKNSNYYYFFSPDSVAKIHGRLKQVDGFITSVFTGDEIDAFSLDAADSGNFKRFKTEELTRPAWVDSTFMEDKRYYYGVGLYTAMGNENDAWRTTEEQGIFTILNAVAIDFNKIEIKNTTDQAGSGALQQVTIIKLKFRLRNIQVLERYPDRKNKVFYALIRIPKKDVLSKTVK